FHFRTLAQVALRSLLLVGLVAVIFVPFYWLEGPGTLGFLAYHRERGLEVGSTYSSLLVLLARFGHPVQVYFSSGGYNVRSPLSPVLLSLAPFLAAAALLAATGTLLLRLRRLPPSPDQQAASSATLAQHNPLLFIQFTFLLLLVFMATNKVFSPQ